MNDEEKLISEINANLITGKVSHAKLSTDDRVLARITDGIYRQPASALRELIANAYDADASTVYIQTDFPKFNQISVRDDGNGLTVEGLANLIHHIGGSPKRTRAGVGLGVVNESDPSLSPAGRRLIGKIGIGLFSVAQLTRHFQIITKTKGSNHRLVAEIMLKTYTEDDLAIMTKQDHLTFETGTVDIQSFSAVNEEAHGTEIILMDLRKQTKEMLQSRDVWLRADLGRDLNQLGTDQRPPTYHIGRMAPGSDELLSESKRLPWKDCDPPETRFAKLYQAIIEQIGVEEATPKLETVLDNYLRMLWTLSLSAPIDYIEKHPFDLTVEDDPSYYLLANTPKGQAKKILMKKGESLRSQIDLHAPERGKKTPFRIIVDEVELRRPIRFNNLPETGHAVKKPMLFVGQCTPDLSSIPKDIRGGDLAFEGYFLWTPKVVPKENTGVLIRISDASGTLFDESFLKYQISEQTRLRQITAEIFVLKGLDPALNIDRESFNYAHPHYQFLMKWVRNALRQLANTQKAAATAVRSEVRKVYQDQRQQAVETCVIEEIKQAGKNPDTEIPEVVFSRGNTKDLFDHRTKGALAFDTEVIFAPVPKPGRVTTVNQAERDIFEEKIKGVAKILEAYGVFEGMPYAKQQKLLRSIVAIFVSGE